MKLAAGTSPPREKTSDRRTALRRRFRVRFQDGVVELGVGLLLLGLTLLNFSEYFFPRTSTSAQYLVLIQPSLSLLWFTGCIFAIRACRHWLISRRDGPAEIPLASPLLWATLLLMVMLLAAPLVWPLEPYADSVWRWIFLAGGLLWSGFFLYLGWKNRLRRFRLLGSACILLSLSFNWLGQPGSFSNRLGLLVGISLAFFISGGTALTRYLRLTKPLQR